jgi:hypothetical protein
MLYYKHRRLNGLWSPFGIETLYVAGAICALRVGLNGLWSPFGIETCNVLIVEPRASVAKWPVEPVRD